MPSEKVAKIRRVLMFVAVGIGVLGVCATFPYWQHAWVVISDGYQGPDTGMALGIMLVVVGPTVLLGLGLALVAEPRRWPLSVNGFALFGLLFWFVAVSVPAPRPTLPPYEAPQPAYVCGSASPFGGEEGERWRVSLAIDFDPSAVQGHVAREGEAPVEVLPEQCSYDGTFRCTVPGVVPSVWIQPTLQTDTGSQTGDPLPQTNCATVSFRTEDTSAHTDLLPYSRSCEPNEVARARRERDDRFYSKLLLREWYRSLRGIED